MTRSVREQPHSCRLAILCSPARTRTAIYRYLVSGGAGKTMRSPLTANGPSKEMRPRLELTGNATMLEASLVLIMDLNSVYIGNLHRDSHKTGKGNTI